MFMDGALNEPVGKYKKIFDINVVAQYAILKTGTDVMKTQLVQALET